VYKYIISARTAGGRRFNVSTISDSRSDDPMRVANEWIDKCQQNFPEYIDFKIEKRLMVSL
jgi:hypothetical protein